MRMLNMMTVVNDSQMDLQDHSCGIRSVERHVGTSGGRCASASFGSLAAPRVTWGVERTALPASSSGLLERPSVQPSPRNARGRRLERQAMSPAFVLSVN